MDAINAGAKAINDSLAYLKENAWPIAIMLVMWFYMRPKVLDVMDDMKTRRSPEQEKNYNNDMRRVRQMQQLQAEQDAKITAQQLKEKKTEESLPEKKEKKKEVKIPASTKPANSNSSLSMGNFSTPSYRPQRRTVRKG